MANLSKFREFCPHLKVGQTFGSGHFSTLLVPEQVNAMIQGFERAYVRQWPVQRRQGRAPHQDAL
jgi:hypothetical protein